MRTRIAGLTATIALGGLVFAAPAASAQVTKYSFQDVTLPDGRTGEIEAGVKVLKNKPDSVTCSYFTDGYETWLGQHFTFNEPGPADADTVLELCLDGFDDRET